MDANDFQNAVFLKRYYAGHALTGLLADGRLSHWLTADGKVDPEGPKRLAALAFNLADAMAEQSFHPSQQ